MKKASLLLLTLLCLTGCQPAAKLLLGMDRQYEFSSREEMAAHFYKKNRIEKERLYFFDDIAQQNAFVRDELQGRISGTFYALAVNDSLKLAEDPTVIFIVHSVMGRAINGSAGYVTKRLKKDKRMVNYVTLPLTGLCDNKTVNFTQSGYRRQRLFERTCRYWTLDYRAVISVGCRPIQLRAFIHTILQSKCPKSIIFFK